MDALEIQQVTTLPPQILTLEKQATAEGFRFITRLISEWQSAANRFDAPGECLLAAYIDSQLVGIGGLSFDPFAQQQDVGRLRRVYVAHSSRGQNVGRTLVNNLLQHAAQRFSIVRLSTDTVEGATFYARCGFQPLEDTHATHIKWL